MIDNEAVSLPQTPPSSRFEAIFIRAQTRPFVVMFALFALAMGLRLLLLSQKSFWFDELLSLNVMRRGLDLLWSGQSDFHPPLYYYLLMVVTRFGDDEFWLRFPSAVAGALAIFPTYWIGAELAGRKTGIIAAALVAVSPLLIWYSQEARPYAVLCLLGLLATAAAVRLFLRPHWLPGLLLAVLMAATLYTHYFAVLVWGVQVVLLMALLATQRIRWRVALYWLLSVPLTLLLYWPWLRSSAVQRFGRLIDGTYPVKLAVQVLGLDTSMAQLLPRLVVPFLVLAILGALLCYGVFVIIQRKQWATRLLNAAWLPWLLVGAFIIIAVLSVTPRGYSIKRQLVVLWPYGLLLLSGLLLHVKQWQRWTAVIIVVALAAALTNILFIPKDDWRAATAFVLQQVEPGDRIWIEPAYFEIPFAYYSENQIEVEGLELAAGQNSLRRLAGDTERIWHIVHTADRDPRQRNARWLERWGEPINSAEFFHLTVTQFSREN